jgi:hypothetical protein
MMRVVGGEMTPLELTKFQNENEKENENEYYFVSLSLHLLQPLRYQPCKT